jgi:hypothetical protein
MTITFKCPHCGYLCAFKDTYAGRRARCLNCSRSFIIPQSDNAPVEKIIPPKVYEEPLPGYFEAVFKKSFPAIFSKQSFTTLFFILVAITFKSFLAHLDFTFNFSCRGGGQIFIPLPLGSIFACLAWGAIFYCYAEIIYATAYDTESLPEITFGGGWGFIASAFKSLISFVMAMIISLLPAVIFKIIFSAVGITSNWALLPFVLLSIFLFPMAVLLVSISRDIQPLFVPKHFIVPIKKAFRYYAVLAMFFYITGQLQIWSHNYGDAKTMSILIIALNLLFALAIQILAVFAMRATGLFYRHFACYIEI